MQGLFYRSPMLFNAQNNNECPTYSVEDYYHKFLQSTASRDSSGPLCYICIFILSVYSQLTNSGVCFLRGGNLVEPRACDSTLQIKTNTHGITWDQLFILHRG